MKITIQIDTDRAALTPLERRLYEALGVAIPEETAPDDFDPDQYQLDMLDTLSETDDI